MGVEVAISSAAAITKVGISNGHCTNSHQGRGKKTPISIRTYYLYVP